MTYDLPGFGESDPHPDRDLESSALDMLHLSYTVNITHKFWVLGFSGGCVHAWAALRYIPDRVAGIGSLILFLAIHVCQCSFRGRHRNQNNVIVS